MRGVARSKDHLGFEGPGVKSLMAAENVNLSRTLSGYY